MQTDIPTLFVEINDLNYNFVVGKYDENQNLKIIEKIITPNEGIQKNKFINIELAQKSIKKNIRVIEDKINYVFKEAIVIIDTFENSCINISGFKKLNGSQILKENISYILNSLKLAISENEKKKTILHIFNSKSVLDGICIENLPIGLFGDFYSHELTFFLIDNNDVKNLKKIFNKNNLSIKKILIKNFIEGTQIINQNNNKVETFFKIKINKNKSHISFFDKASFRYEEYFNFGTSIILKDIAKVCSIKNETIIEILSNNLFKNNKLEDDSEFLEEKYFTKESYRKIRKKLIIDIVNARVEEIVNIILNRNINIKSLQQNNAVIFIIIEDQLIFNNFQKNFKFYISQKYNFVSYLIDNFQIDSTIMSAAYLSAYGWKKEAIPVAQTKNSLITRIFKSIFE
tara:strand:- start:4183 stop:5388 length:1206 start_codon:yes stop_codon:yes gene_type:complete